MNGSLKRTLSLILDDRKQTIWGTSLGIPKTVISEFFRQGKYPADKHLTKLVKAENVSMDALWGSSPKPFLVSRTNDATETNKELFQSLDDNYKTIHLVTYHVDLKGRQYPVIILSKPVVENKGTVEEFAYTSIHLICGPTNHETVSRLSKHRVLLKRMDAFKLHLIATGFAGTYHLFGKDTLKDTRQATRAELSEILYQQYTNSAELLNKIIQMVDDTIIEEGAEVNLEKRRKLVVELYTYAEKEGLMADKLSPNMAQSMLRLV